MTGTDGFMGLLSTAFIINNRRQLGQEWWCAEQEVFRGRPAWPFKGIFLFEQHDRLPKKEKSLND